MKLALIPTMQKNSQPTGHITNLIKTLAYIIIWMVIFTIPAKGQHSQFEKLSDTYVQRYVDNGDFSGNILIAKGDKVIFNKSYGKSNYELNIPMRSDVRFRIASVSKTFTAAAVVLLNNQGALSYSDKLSKYIPDFTGADRISILHLLLHQSGVADIEYDNYALDRLSLDETVNTIKSKPLYFEPGSGSRYSNSGYLLLAYVIQKASGMRYDQYLKEAVFDKLQMSNTTVEHTGEIIINKASGYAIGNRTSNIATAAWYDIDLETGSGSIVSTTGDLLKWARAVDENILFNRLTLPFPFGRGPREYFKNKKSIEQSGFLNGYSSYITVYPDDDLVIVALSNISSCFNEKSGRDLAAIYYGEKYDLPKRRVPFEPLDLNAYTGKYSWPGYKEFVIERKGDGIQWRFIDEKNGSPLAPVAKDTFVLRLMNSTIKFRDVVNGKSTALTFSTGADETLCNRIE